MNSRGLPWLLLLSLSPAVVFACGGKTGGVGSDGGPGSSSSSGGVSSSSSGSSSGGISSSSSGSSSGGEPVDAMPVEDSPSVLYCKNNGMSGSGGSGSCDIGGTETCTDGNTYSVDCQCPQATCTCTQTGPNGGSSGGGFSYSGCPGCTTSDLFTLCGFPQ